MSKANSTETHAPSKPERPEGSPLFWHASGRWCKKIRGKQVYFGRGSHEDALADYERQKADLHAGRTLRDEDEGLTAYRLCAKFLTTKTHLRDTGEISPHTLSDYAAACKLILKAFGRNRLVPNLRPGDFEKLRKTMATKWGPVRIGNTINKVRIVFNYAFKNGLIDRPMVFGEGFRRPSKKVIRKHHQTQGPRMFEAHEIRAMLEQATLPLRAMLLLGVQAGFGNSDLGNLPLTALDLEKGFINYPRAKTAIERRVPLWNETVQALREWLQVRPIPANEEHAGLVFLTAKGACWAKSTNDNPVSKETAKLLKKCNINGHRNFYALRHTFQTIGDESGDFLAVRRIMGHASNDIADAYRERVSDERLRKVVQYVREWLFATKETPDVLPNSQTQVG